MPVCACICRAGGNERGQGKEGGSLKPQLLAPSVAACSEALLQMPVYVGWVVEGDGG